MLIKYQLGNHCVVKYQLPDRTLKFNGEMDESECYIAISKK